MSDAYGPNLVIDAFFNGPELPPEKTGGWLVMGHDAADIYQEFVVVGEWTADRIPHDWIDFIRIPLEVGSPLVTQ